MLDLLRNLRAYNWVLKLPTCLSLTHPQPSTYKKSTWHWIFCQLLPYSFTIYAYDLNATQFNSAWPWTLQTWCCMHFSASFLFSTHLFHCYQVFHKCIVTYPFSCWWTLKLFLVWVCFQTKLLWRFLSKNCSWIMIYNPECVWPCGDLGLSKGTRSFSGNQCTNHIFCSYIFL